MTPKPAAVSLVFKIVGAEEWSLAEAAGAFRGAAIDLADGYIHLSTADQVGETAARWFARRGDLILVAVDAVALGQGLRWEVSRGGARFPHLYSELPMTAVRWRRPLALAADGKHEFGRLDR